MEPVYYKIDDSSFPSGSGEEFGYWVGFAEHVGHNMTYRIWNQRTGKILDRSAVRSARDNNPNMKASLTWTPYRPPTQSTHSPPTMSDRVSTDQDYGEKESGRPPDIKSPHKDNRKEINSHDDGEMAYLDELAEMSTEPEPYDTNDFADDSRMVVLTDGDGNPVIDSQGQTITIKGKTAKEIQGKSFKHRQDDGSILRARVVGPTGLLNKFKVKYDTTDVEDVMAYNDIMNYIHRDETEEEGYLWKFRRILGHQGPLSQRHHDYKGCIYNVSVEWENGEITYEPVSNMILDDPVTMARYAKDNDLLDQKGWRKLKSLAKREKKLDRLVKQARLRSFKTSPKYKYGFQVPRDYNEAVAFDLRNGNVNWAKATKLEMQQLKDYETFKDLGEFQDSKIPEGYKRIKVHLVFDVKHDGRHKARLVADGHLTDVPLDGVYAGVVSLRGLRMCIFLAELNGMQAYATDIGNAYLEAKTREKVCIKAGSEFGELAGHLLVIHKALYGLRSSGKQFGELLAACLKELGFKPSKAESEIFYREKNGIYEYVATYVDDLCLVMKDPEAFLKVLQSAPYNFKLKGSGPLEFHLGCGFGNDEDGTLYLDPKRYIEKMVQAYEQLYGEKPSTKFHSPLEHNDHPELDTSEFLNDDGIQQYQSLIGSLQWAISISRWDIQTAVMSMSSFRAQPRKGHLERVKRIYGYLYKFIDFKIRFKVTEPDLEHLEGKAHFDWSNSVYGDSKEDIPTDAPKPLGKRVTLSHYFDANLMHDVLSGKAVTGCVHFANKTPIMWHSKKQATSETATYGAEFIAGRTCIEQVIDLRNSFRYLGVPINDVSYVFGDNETMIDSSTFPHARLHKRHNILSYHYVRSMIAKGFLAMHHIQSGDNVADVVSKHWSHASVYHTLLKPVFHHIGNTAKLFIDDSPGCLDGVISNPSDADGEY